MRHLLAVPDDVGDQVLAEIAGGLRLGGVTAQLLLLCFEYNPALGKYTATTMTVLRIAGGLLVAAFGVFLAVSLGRERRSRARVGANA